VISVDRLTKRYGKVLAVDELTFRAEPGRVTGFLGPNGAGKTTTLRILVGLLRATDGDATVLGRAYLELEDPTRMVGAVLEASGFHPGRSGDAHLRTLATAAGLPRRRVGEVLELVGLSAAARRRVRGYSLGMRQRLSLAGALLGDPRVLILDEPANGLDPQGIRWLRDLLRGFAAEGRTVLVSSHVLAEVQQLADDVVIIARGRIVTQGGVGEVVAGAGGAVRVRSPQLERLREALAGAGLEASSVDEQALSVRETTSARVGEIAAAEGIVLHELREEEATLEEVFLELTGGET
jgi:ABC-2 type transport system ATP-binding protein